YSIAGGWDGKHVVFLMDARTKKKIGPLTEIEEPLDNAPDALHATWSPDSRHVAIMYREDRHLGVMKLYRIENRRAFIVDVPSLFGTVAPHFDRESFKMTATSRGTTGLVWKSPIQFELSETSHYWRVRGNPKAKLGKFIKIEDDSDGRAVYFSAEAI